ncbi:thiamine phosphate synthase [Mangrovivirga cuniculi]|nr:thiamine phosphate synthase [Mangrovivirga cuniculi]
MKKSRINSGIYLVIDPSEPLQETIDILNDLLEEGLAAVQIWDNFKKTPDLKNYIKEIKKVCKDFDTPVLINNQKNYLLNLHSMVFTSMKYPVTSIGSNPMSLIIEFLD